MTSLVKKADPAQNMLVGNGCDSNELSRRATKG